MWENECFLKADLCIHRVTPQWLQSNARLNQHHLHNQKLTSKSLQNDPKVTPKCPKVTSKWYQSDINVSYDRRKSLGKIFLICFCAHLGPTWGRSEANLHSIRPDKGKRDPKRIPNGPKMVPKWAQNASKSDTNRPDRKRNLLSIRIDMQWMGRLGRSWYLIRATDGMSIDR